MALSFLPNTGAYTSGGNYYETLRRLASQPAPQGAWGQGGGSSWGQGFGQPQGGGRQGAGAAPPYAPPTGQSLQPVAAPASGWGGLPYTQATGTPSGPPANSYAWARQQPGQGDDGATQPAGTTGALPPNQQWRPLAGDAPEPANAPLADAYRALTAQLGNLGNTPQVSAPSTTPGQGWGTSESVRAASSPNPGIDPFTGQPFPGMDWGDPGVGPNPSAPPATVPPTTPPQIGLPVSQTGRGWRHINESDAISYNQHPQQAFLQFAADTFGANTPAFQWAQEQMPRLWADYYRQTENGREDLAWTDYLTRQLQVQLRNEFSNQSSRARGVNAGAQTPRIAW